MDILNDNLAKIIYSYLKQYEKVVCWMIVPDNKLLFSIIDGYSLDDTFLACYEFNWNAGIEVFLTPKYNMIMQNSWPVYRALAYLVAHDNISMISKVVSCTRYPLESYHTAFDAAISTNKSNIVKLTGNLLIGTTKDGGLRLGLYDSISKGYVNCIKECIELVKINEGIDHAILLECCVEIGKSGKIDVFDFIFDELEINEISVLTIFKSAVTHNKYGIIKHIASEYEHLVNEQWYPNLIKIALKNGHRNIAQKMYRLVTDESIKAKIPAL